MKKKVKIFNCFLSIFLVLVACQSEKTPEASLPQNNDLQRFTSNPYFESLLQQNMTNSLKINLQKPILNQVFVSKNGKVEVELEGYCLPETSKIPSLVFKVFPNQFDNTQGNTPLLEHKLKIKKEKKGEKYFFSYQTEQALSKGLYYFFVEEEGAKLPHTVGRFTVED